MKHSAEEDIYVARFFPAGDSIVPLPKTLNSLGF